MHSGIRQDHREWEFPRWPWLIHSIHPFDDVLFFLVVCHMNPSDFCQNWCISETSHHITRYHIATYVWHSLQGASPYPTLGKGKSSTQKCLFLGDMWLFPGPGIVFRLLLAEDNFSLHHSQSLHVFGTLNFECGRVRVTTQPTLTRDLALALDGLDLPFLYPNHVDSNTFHSKLCHLGPAALPKFRWCLSESREKGRLQMPSRAEVDAILQRWKCQIVFFFLC